ncbi:MAG: hypothetical protein ACK58T_02550 [Phycisphaerae bacterium]
MSVANRDPDHASNAEENPRQTVSSISTSKVKSTPRSDNGHDERCLTGEDKLKTDTTEQCSLILLQNELIHGAFDGRAFAGLYALQKDEERKQNDRSEQEEILPESL